ncbi:MAG: transposase [Xanthomonadales bacterium]|nr:transposase [Xanthomonadales bacterium]MBN8794184.1 transposase [Stenotrophomonas nitritireducens]
MAQGCRRLDPGRGRSARIAHDTLPHGAGLEDEGGAARHPGLAPFKRLAKTVQAHSDGIRNRLAAGHSNARAGFTNAAIQAAIARVCGFRTFKHLRTFIDLARGGLKLTASPVAGRATR